MGSVADQSLALGRTAAQPCQVGFGGRLVDEDQPRRVERALLPPPAASGARHVRPVLLGRMERLFLYVSPSLLTIQWIAATVQSSSRRSFISARVRSGSWAISCFSFAPWFGISLAFRPENRCRGLKSPVLALCPSSFFTIPTDTLKRFATSALVPSFAS
ncbi:MAG: hypothetical protein JWM32_412 [Verrucomicrobia bacterium]|nr:hypothetical protein [Verrucomicrobiota bacterium]